jgi:hypothetical protein
MIQWELQVAEEATAVATVDKAEVMTIEEVKVVTKEVATEVEIMLVAAETRATVAEIEAAAEMTIPRPFSWVTLVLTLVREKSMICSGGKD